MIDITTSNLTLNERLRTNDISINSISKRVCVIDCFGEREISEKVEYEIYLKQ